jgi:ankyrin repeat protein
MHSTEALPLPHRPDIVQYKKLAKELLGAVKSGDATAIQAWATRWFRELYRLSGEERSEKYRLLHQVRTEPIDSEIERDARRFAAYWTGERKVKDIPPPRQTLAHAQFIIARVHGFTHWAALVHHIDSLWRGDSSIARFEAAVDAIVLGDDVTLTHLLRKHPELVKERSSRDHGCTLLHYVAANGIEGYRQRTPVRIVAITELLLAAGADVNATAKCYGARDTVLGLTATSMHPHNAGVLIPMLETLVAAGADVNHTDGGWTMVRACLANGQPEAARWLADHGSQIDLAGAAGLGHLDQVKWFVAPDGTLRNGATPAQLDDAWEHASWYGQVDVMRYLMDAGLDPARARDDGATALHRAAYAGQADLVDLLLARGAPNDVRDRAYGTTPLTWALHAWRTEGRSAAEAPAYARIVAALGGDPDA